MEKQESEEYWEVVDYYEEEEEGKVQKWSSRMMDAGKKLVMTGVVIASAPVVVPPLLVVSALGFAMSVPFGVIFASYAATHKVMTKLLPLPPLPATWNSSSNYYQQDEEEVMNMKLNEIEMMRIGYEDPIAHDDAQVIIGRDDLQEEEEAAGEEEEESMKKQPVQVTESGDGAVESSSSSNDNKNENIVNHVVDDEEELKKMTVETKQEGLILRDDDTPAAVRDEVKMGVAEPEELNGGKGKHTVSLNGGLQLHSSSDEEIWRKINAIRVIVGFKAPRRTSYLQELKALYLFTGIEPPTPTPTAADFDANLTFLMSVIGLK